MCRCVTNTAEMLPNGSAASRIAATCRGSSGPGSITASWPAPAPTSHVLVPVRVIGPGLGASTRWITSSEYRQLDLTGRTDAHRYPRGPPIRARPAVAAAARIPAPTMPRARQLAPVQGAFAERAAIVRAIVVQRVELALD